MRRAVCRNNEQAKEFWQQGHLVAGLKKAAGKLRDAVAECRDAPCSLAASSACCMCSRVLRQRLALLLQRAHLHTATPAHSLTDGIPM